jgi:hypothetical protein
MNFKHKERIILVIALLSAGAFLVGSVWYAKLILASL